jgi:hypothetical protein
MRKNGNKEKMKEEERGNEYRSENAKEEDRKKKGSGDD